VSLDWTDVQEIAIALAESKPEIDPKTLNFVDLQHWILALPNFIGTPERCGEKVLEAIQAAWLDEVD